MFRLAISALIFLCLLFPTNGFSHGGGLDSKGGHYNRKTGEYHFHKKVSQSTDKPVSATNYSTTKEVGASNFHGNTGSRIFHDPSCRYFNCKNCGATFTSREQAIDAGYRPCKSCGS